MKNFYRILKITPIILFALIATSFEHLNTEDAIASKVDEIQRVYICGGKYATKFHSKSNCYGLNNCKGEIYYYDSVREAQKNGFSYCKICWK